MLWLLVGWVGWLVGLFNCWDTMGYSLPEVESAQQFLLRVIHNLIHNAGQGGGGLP
jgi:hypothetical protein